MKVKAMTRLSGLALASLLALAVPTTVQAGPIVIDAGWYGFCFAGVGSPATAGCQNEGIGVSGNPSTFTATGAVLLKVTDAFDHGDVFSVFNFGIPLFTTSAVPTSGGAVSNPDLAFLDPLYSHGSIVLGAGSYSIDIFAAASPFGGGGAYLEVETTVPEPGTLALVGAGILGLAARRRRRA